MSLFSFYFQYLPHPQHGHVAYGTNGQNNVEIVHSEVQHEQILYNTLRFELQQVIEAYLQRTRQIHPINFVFDFSGVPVQRLQ